MKLLDSGFLSRNYIKQLLISNKSSEWSIDNGPLVCYIKGKKMYRTIWAINTEWLG